MTTRIFILLAALSLAACTSKKEEPGQKAEVADTNHIVITNDMEHADQKIPSWNNEKAVIRSGAGQAHSGEFESRVGKDNNYSYAYSENFGNLSARLPKKVLVHGWIKSPEPDQSIGMVMDVNDSGKTVIWKSFSLGFVMKKPDTWYEFLAYFHIDKPVTPAYNIKLYGFSQTKTAFFDDLQITFEY